MPLHNAPIAGCLDCRAPCSSATGGPQRSHCAALLLLLIAAVPITTVQLTAAAQALGLLQNQSQQPDNNINHSCTKRFV
jgi:hypothetical protein